MKAPSEEIYDKSIQGTCGLQLSIFICLAVVASQICEILQKFELTAVQGHWSWCQS